MKRTPLPKRRTILQFKPNKYNCFLFEANVNGKNLATIQQIDGKFDLYTDMPSCVYEGNFTSYQAAISRAEWRANL